MNTLDNALVHLHMRFNSTRFHRAHFKCWSAISMQVTLANTWDASRLYKLQVGL